MITNKSQDKIVKILKATGTTANWWSQLNISPRLYIQTKYKDRKIYVSFDDAEFLHGPKLNVYINNCGQPLKWYVSQQKIMIDSLQREFGLIVAMSRHLDNQPITNDVRTMVKA